MGFANFGKAIARESLRSMPRPQDGWYETKTSYTLEIPVDILQGEKPISDLRPYLVEHQQVRFVKAEPIMLKGCTVWNWLTRTGYWERREEEK